jgi:hypothetical protein
MGGTHERFNLGVIVSNYKHVHRPIIPNSGVTHVTGVTEITSAAFEKGRAQELEIPGGPNQQRKASQQTHSFTLHLLPFAKQIT